MSFRYDQSANYYFYIVVGKVKMRPYCMETSYRTKIADWIFLTRYDSSWMVIVTLSAGPIRIQIHRSDSNNVVIIIELNRIGPEITGQFVAVAADGNNKWWYNTNDGKRRNLNSENLKKIEKYDRQKNITSDPFLAVIPTSWRFISFIYIYIYYILISILGLLSPAAGASLVKSFQISFNSDGF